MASPIDQHQGSDAKGTPSAGGTLLSAEGASGQALTHQGAGRAIRSRRFGEIPESGTVDAWTMTSRGGLVLEVITLGGIVRQLLAPGRDGTIDDVVLGFNDLASYVEGHPYFGAITGRAAGRIANAAFTLDDTTYQLSRNEPPNHLHGGRRGFDKRIWNAAPVDRADGAPSLRLTYLSPDGGEGYPGDVDVAVAYTVTDRNEFLVETEATSDRTTPLCMTDHSCFNLAGEGAAPVADHRLEIFADETAPVDKQLILTGRLEATASGNDFRRARRVGDAIPMLFEQHGDMYRLPAHGAEERVTSAWLKDPATRRVLTVSTTERYLQFYTGSHLIETRPGKLGKAYGPFAGLCLECQGYADAANEAMRAETLLYPGQTQRHATAYTFSVDAT